MFGDLFDDEEKDSNFKFKSSDSASLSTISKKLGLEPPPAPRLCCGLCGIKNQGATCYLNSLLQTLFLTPEFRESLFALNAMYLGQLCDAKNPDAKVRVIPLQLQRLFARLLLNNQQCIITNELTDSFGWNNSEEMQQHDVQELNRILFSAIEDSLIGTSGQTLISELYHGTVVNQIVCHKCGRVSEREEDFLDISIPIHNNSNLETSLMECYIATEIMDGNNQYRCEKCAELVDAEKGAKIRSLPKILTFSLLRFSFDFVKLERYKETGKFTFPLEIDISPFCEHPNSPDSSNYELFSVVIHRGGAHGGHYHAFIRDIDDLGSWIHPDEEEIQLPTDPSTGKVDFIEFDSPVDLIHAILSKEGEHGMAIDKLCAELVKQTGVSWNKRFKKKHGPINKFLKKYDDKFNFHQVTNMVYAKLCSPVGTQVEEKSKCEQVENNCSYSTECENRHRKKPQSPVPSSGQCWYDFDDSRVHPIRAKDIEKQFSGKESAYMLFYRNKSMARSYEGEKNPYFCIPEPLERLVLQENEELGKMREEYDLAVNKIQLNIYFSRCFQFARGALQLLPSNSAPKTITLDRRKSVMDLMEVLRNEFTEEWDSLHLTRLVPAGYHLYNCISEEKTIELTALNICDGDNIFCWDGKQVGGDTVLPGSDVEPILLHVSYSNIQGSTGDVISQGFPKCTTVLTMCGILASLVDCDRRNIVLKRIIRKEQETKLIEFSEEEMNFTLEQAKLTDGDELLVHDGLQQAHCVHEMPLPDPKAFPVFIECRLEEKEDGAYPVATVAISTNESVGDLKSKAITARNTDIPHENCRLRIDDDNFGLRPPLHEDQTASTAGMKKGTRLVLERGLAPKSNEITLSFTSTSTTDNTLVYDIVIERNATVAECLLTMISKAEFEGDDWHMRKVNWCGEPDAILDDLDLTLDQCHLYNGTHLLLESGRLPPKGFINVPVWLYTTESISDESSLSWLSNYLNHELTFGKQLSPNISDNLVMMGTVQLPKESTLLDLKIQIMTLPSMSEAPLPTVDFLRVRLLENRRPTTVLRNCAQTLQRLKVTNSSQLCIQVLQTEEDLNDNQTILLVQQCIPNTRIYTPPEEVVWNISQGATAKSLRQFLADRFCLPVEKTVIAKHFPDKFEWMEIKDNKSAKNSKNRKKGGKNKCNIHHAPYHIQDGDCIGVKDLQFDRLNEGNFTTSQDDEGLENIKKEIEEKQRWRKESQARTTDLIGVGCENKKNRPEIGITIKVGNFK